MNEARKRRDKIRSRARKAMIRRLSHMMNHTQKIDLSDQIIRPATRLARVYLKLEMGLDEVGFKTSVAVHLPADNPTETIRDMQKNGFWCPRLDDGLMVFIPAKQILQVHMEIKDSDFSGWYKKESCLDKLINQR